MKHQGIIPSAGVVRLLTEEQVNRIHKASLEILNQVGLEVHHPQARALFRKHGGRVQDELQRVTLPPAVIEQCLEAIPPRFTFHARHPRLDRSVPDDAPPVMTASSAPNPIDLVTRELHRTGMENKSTPDTRGLEFSEAELALDEIKAVGPGGMFVATDLTLERIKSSALLPAIADRESRSAWLKKGAEDRADRTLTRAREILELDCPTHFSPEVEARILQRFKGLIGSDGQDSGGTAAENAAKSGVALTAN